MDKRIEKYQLKNGDVRYMFKGYMGIDHETGKDVITTRRGFLTAKDAELSLFQLIDETKGNDAIRNKIILDNKLKQIKYTFEELNKLSNRLDDNMLLDIAYKLSNEVGLREVD